MSSTLKIIIVGLDNSGKSSILLAMTENTNIMSFMKLKPTQGVVRSNVEAEDSKYTLWDLGGQDKYRNEYIRDLDKYARGTDAVIYVIDVQDKKRYQLSLDYMKKILSGIKNLKDIKLKIFLHKFDPNLADNNEYSGETLKAELLDKIDEIIPSDINYKVFKTSIYAQFIKTMFYER